MSVDVGADAGAVASSVCARYIGQCHLVGCSKSPACLVCGRGNWPIVFAHMLIPDHLPAPDFKAKGRPASIRFLHRIHTVFSSMTPSGVLADTVVYFVTFDGDSAGIIQRREHNIVDNCLGHQRSPFQRFQAFHFLLPALDCDPAMPVVGAAQQSSHFIGRRSQASRRRATSAGAERRQ